jgi:GNAT superfamily N-acetyltransferase
MSSSLDYQVADYDQESAKTQTQAFRELYAEVYVEEPYCEGEEDFLAFDERFADQCRQAEFKLFAAWRGPEILGYIYGFRLTPGSDQYGQTFFRRLDEATAPAPDDVAYVSELLVSGSVRGQGIARTLHNRFVASRAEQQVALLAHPGAVPAQTAYHKWGYRKWGEGIPFVGAGFYDTLVLANQPVSGKI